MTPEEILQLDPFTTIYRTFGTRSSSQPLGHSVFHLDPACPWLKGEGGKRGRLGAQLAAGRGLCSYERGHHPNLGGGPRATPKPMWKRLEAKAKGATA